MVSKKYNKLEATGIAINKLEQKFVPATDICKNNTLLNMVWNRISNDDSTMIEIDEAVDDVYKDILESTDFSELDL